MLIGVTEFTEKPPDFICPASGFLHFTKPGGEGNLAGLGFFEHTTFEVLALPGPVPIDPTSPILAKGGAVIVSADHGNAEQMKLADGSPMTSHSVNPVPLMLIGAGKVTLRNDGKLADIAPTMLELLGMDKPAEMTGTSLIAK